MVKTTAERGVKGWALTRTSWSCQGPVDNSRVCWVLPLGVPPGCTVWVCRQLPMLQVPLLPAQRRHLAYTYPTVRHCLLVLVLDVGPPRPLLQAVPLIREQLRLGEGGGGPPALLDGPELVVLLGAFVEVAHLEPRLMQVGYA